MTRQDLEAEVIRLIKQEIQNKRFTLATELVMHASFEALKATYNLALAMADAETETTENLEAASDILDKEKRP